MVIVFRVRGRVESGAVFFDGDVADPSDVVRMGHRIHAWGASHALPLRISHMHRHLRAGDVPVAHCVVGEEDGGLLLLFLAVLIELFPATACRVACTAASARRTPAALPRTKRRLVARVGGRAVQPTTRTVAAPWSRTLPSSASSSGGAVNGCRHCRD